MKALFALHPPILVGLFSLFVSYFYIIFLVGAVVMLFDIIARYKEYNFMCNIVDDEKLMSMTRYMKSSWCTRTVAKAAYHPSREFYKNLNYKFYHILPDNFHKRVITKKFWLSLFGFIKTF